MIQTVVSWPNSLRVHYCPLSKLIAFRAITENERKYSVFEAMRKAKVDARLVGVREKRARQKAEEAKQVKKPGK